MRKLENRRRRNYRSDMMVTIYFATSNMETIRRIRAKFGMPQTGMTVNGEQVADIKDEDLPTLREVEKMGYIQIRKK